MKGMYITDHYLIRSIIAKRQRDGHDRRDEVWDGVYFIPPITDNEHQEISSHLSFAFHQVVDWRKIGISYTTINVSDRNEDWLENFREPDLSVYLDGNPARDRDTHYQGGGDLIVEILTRGDRARKKLGFYAAVGVRECLVIDRRPWALELYRAREGKLELVGTATPEGAEILTSEVLPLMFRLVPGEERPRIEVARRDGAEHWTI